MNILFNCPTCKVEIEVLRTCMGSQMECRCCHTQINIPDLLYAAKADPAIKRVFGDVSGVSPSTTGSSDVDYTFILGPGVVRYLAAYRFLRSDVESVIAELKQASDYIEMSSPPVLEAAGARINLAELDALFPSEPWDARLRAHHKIASFLVQNRLPWSAYREFHIRLGLGAEPALLECLESLVNIANMDAAAIRSYSKSPDYLVIHGFVYRRTAIVNAKLAALALAAEEKRARLAQNILSKSRFRTFVYLMEDLRNGAFKIGHSTTPGKRERTLQSEVPEIVLRLSFPGEQTHEKYLHDHFAAKRVRGEWFSLAPEDLLWILFFLKQNGDASRGFADCEWLGSVVLRANANPCESGKDRTSAGSSAGSGRIIFTPGFSSW